MSEKMYNGIEEYDKTIKEAIGMRIQDVRIEAGMTGADLGAYLGVNANQISRIERGEANIDIGKLYVICKLFDVSADYILLGQSCNSITDKQSEAISNLISVFGGD